MSVQIIEKDGRPEWAIIPYETYQRLIEDIEMLQDIRAYDEAMTSVEAGEGLVPAQVLYAIIDGENPIKAWRQHRGMTQRKVAEAAEISVPYLSQLETGKRKGSTEVLVAIARVLDVSLDDIVETGEE